MARLITLLSIIFLIGVVSLTSGKTLPDEYFLSDAALDDLYYLKQAENDLEEGDATNEIDLDPRETTGEMDMEESVVPRSRHRRQSGVDIGVTNDNAHISASHTRRDRHGGTHTASGTYSRSRFGQNSYDLGYDYQMPNNQGGLSATYGNNGYGVSGQRSWTGRTGGRHTLSGNYNRQRGPMGGRNYGLGYDYQSRNGRHSFGGSFNRDSFGGSSGGLNYRYRFRR